jgi:hypothetical protein
MSHFSESTLKAAVCSRWSSRRPGVATKILIPDRQRKRERERERKRERERVTHRQSEQRDIEKKENEHDKTNDRKRNRKPTQTQRQTHKDRPFLNLAFSLFLFSPPTTRPEMSQ